MIDYQAVVKKTLLTFHGMEDNKLEKMRDGILFKQRKREREREMMFVIRVILTIVLWE